MEYALEIEGEPAAWCVYTKRGPPPIGFEKMQAWQEQIRAAVIQKYGRPLLDHAVTMNVVFYRTLPGPRPKSLATWERRCNVALTKRPDRTNLLKALEDGLIGTLLKDDSVVVAGTTLKWFAMPGTKPRTTVRVIPCLTRS